MENWKDIKDYEGLYQVSDNGDVRSLNYNGTKERRNLKFGKTNKYLQVLLYKDKKKKRFLVHRLVAEAFIPNPLNLPQINHKDENPSNNKVSNLEWCDNKYNHNYGTINKRVADKLSKPVLQFTLNGEFVREWSSTAECGRNGFDFSAVAKCCRGKLKQYKGFIWKYKGEA